MIISHPQKSTFGTITATKVITPEIDSVAGDLTIKRAGAAAMTLTAGRITANSNVALAASKTIQDSAWNTMISQGGSGVVNCPASIDTPKVDNSLGNLQLQYMGTTKAYVNSYGMLVAPTVRLGTDGEVQDIGANTIIASDNSGHIDQLARIDAPVTTPIGSHRITLTPQELVGENQSGTMAEGSGQWLNNANDTLHLFLGSLFNQLSMLGVVYLEEITVYMNSGQNGDYVTRTILKRYSATTGAMVDSITDDDDIGNGSTGNENGVLTVNEAVQADQYYKLEYDIVATANVTIRAIKVKYRLT